MTITLTPDLAESLQDTFNTAIKIANMFDVRVRYTFNDFQITLDKTSKFEKLVEAYGASESRSFTQS